MYYADFESFRAAVMTNKIYSVNTTKDNNLISFPSAHTAPTMKKSAQT